MLDIKVVKDLLPKGTRSMVTQELIDKIEDINADPLMAEGFKDNFLSYIGVMKKGKYKIEDYLSAVRFVSHKLLGDTDIDAYTKVFPERYSRLEREGVTREQMGAYVTAYRKNKLVIQVMEQTLVPSHVLNAPLYQEALNVQVNLMMNARSEMVRSRAAESVMEHTRQPETSKIELEIGYKDNDAIADLRAATNQLALMQLEKIQSGMSTTKEVAHSRIVGIIDAEVEEDE